MNTVHSSSSSAEDRFGRGIAARLSVGNAHLPHDIGERLRAARMQALAERKLAPQPRTAPVVVQAGGSAVLGGGWWTRIGSIVPLIVLVAGLMIISAVQDEDRASELADVDAALLTGDLPPAAYTDPGFAQFLKADAAAAGR